MSRNYLNDFYINNNSNYNFGNGLSEVIRTKVPENLWSLWSYILIIKDSSNICLSIKIYQVNLLLHLLCLPYWNVVPFIQSFIHCICFHFISISSGLYVFATFLSFPMSINDLKDFYITQIIISATVYQKW